MENRLNNLNYHKIWRLNNKEKMGRGFSPMGRASLLFPTGRGFNSRLPRIPSMVYLACSFLLDTTHSSELADTLTSPSPLPLPLLLLLSKDRFRLLHSGSCTPTPSS